MNIFGYIAPPVATIGLLIFGADGAHNIDPSGTLSLLSNTSAVGLLGWYLWYTQTKTIPRITKDHKDAVELAAHASTVALKDATELSAKVITGLSDTFKQELATERTRHDHLVEILQKKTE